MILESIALQMTPGIGIKGAVHLLETFGDARRIFAATEEELTGAAELRPDLARALVRRAGFAAAERELVYCRRHGIVPIASTDPAYPALLREIPDYPAVIYLRGEASVLSARTLSVVGTRRATAYGTQMCNRLVEELSGAVEGLCIVSGLAFGIDAAAHRAALTHGVPTVAVLPDPLPDVTPAQHAALAREIVERGGALVTELHGQVKRNGRQYLARNRIIAALSAGCVVVESPGGGGSLFTAHYADGYHRTVMAVPGRATDASSAGTNHLIRTHRAQLVASGEDVLREMMWDSVRMPRCAAPELTPDERRLLECFPAADPIAAERLGETSGLDPGTLATLLVGLELAGAVRQLPGNRYMKL